MDEMVTMIDEAALRLVSAEDADRDAWQELQTHFAALADLLDREDQPRCSQAARRLAELLAPCVAETASDTGSVAELATKTLTALQTIVAQAAGWQEVQMPPELGLDDADSNAQSSQDNSPKRKPAKRRTTKRAAAKSGGTKSRSPQRGAARKGGSKSETDEEKQTVCPGAPKAAKDAEPDLVPPEVETPGEEVSVIDPELLEEFVREAQEHLETADVQLLALETEPRNQESLSAVFRGFHTIKGVAGFMGLGTIGSVAHEAENILDRAREGELLLSGVAIDAIFDAVDALKQLIANLQSGDAAGPAAPLKSVHDLISRLKGISEGETQPATAEPAAIPSTAPAFGSAQPNGAGQPNGTEQSDEKKLPLPEAAPITATASNSQAETLRVDRRRLDSLVDMIGELVIAEAMVQQDLITPAADDAHVGRNLAQLNKITRNLQELSLSLRMVPIRATFQKMARMVRDLSKRLGKPVDFHMIGEDTELDKTVVDEIGDPLMHMVRNAVDHGIEPTVEDRVAADKPARGSVTLKAFHQGGNIYIEIHDDGRGLDPERIRAKARERGILGPDATLSDREALQLIFHPGFSTAEKVTDVSGRGVGMDVVRRNIEALRGSVELSSVTGQGTCVSMRLPLTLAIIDGMAVSVAQQRYILPTLSIVELLRPRSGEIQRVQGKGEFFTLRDEHLPLLRVDRLFGQSQTAAEPTQRTIVVVEHDRKKAGLLVDAVLGQQQAVIKSLGHRLEEQPGLAGGAVMPDGRVGLILDVHGLLGLGANDPSGSLPGSSTQMDKSLIGSASSD